MWTTEIDLLNFIHISFNRKICKKAGRKHHLFCSQPVYISCICVGKEYRHVVQTWLKTCNVNSTSLPPLHTENKRPIPNNWNQRTSICIRRSRLGSHSPVDNRSSSRPGIHRRRDMSCHPRRDGIQVRTYMCTTNKCSRNLAGTHAEIKELKLSPACSNAPNVHTLFKLHSSISEQSTPFASKTKPFSQVQWKDPTSFTHPCWQGDDEHSSISWGRKLWQL